jgi:hypothetical protein
MTFAPDFVFSLFFVLRFLVLIILRSPLPEGSYRSCPLIQAPYIHCIRTIENPRAVCLQHLQKYPPHRPLALQDILWLCQVD